ncbi:hypothetical protein BH09ACT10_BH09ACT10_29420 [soil metagenome]
MYTHLIQVRWSDQDPYEHVNNVLYIVYADEALRALVADGEFDRAGRFVTGCSTEFLRPLAFSPELAAVVSRIEGDTVVQEIFDNRRAEGAPACRVTTTFSAQYEDKPLQVSGATYDCYPRRVETEADGAVGYARQFEHMQEGRAVLTVGIMESDEARQFVIGRVDGTFHRPMTWQPEPYVISSWIHKVGTKSFTIKSATHFAGVLYTECTTVLVGFDLKTQASRSLTDWERAHFDTLIAEAT